MSAITTRLNKIFLIALITAIVATTLLYHTRAIELGASTIIIKDDIDRIRSLKIYDLRSFKTIDSDFVKRRSVLGGARRYKPSSDGFMTLAITLRGYTIFEFD